MAIKKISSGMLAEYGDQMALFEPENNEDVQTGLNLTPMDVFTKSKNAREELERRAKHRSGSEGDSGVQKGSCQTDDSLDDPFAWLETYKQLAYFKFPWRIACYIAWAASPKIKRWPKTQDLLATEVLGLTSDRRITEWRRKMPLIDELVGLFQASPLLDHRADVLDALSVSASNPDHRRNPDRKLFLELTGDYVPHLKVDDGRSKIPSDVAEMTEEELIRTAQMAPKDEDLNA